MDCPDINIIRDRSVAAVADMLGGILSKVSVIGSDAVGFVLLPAVAAPAGIWNVMVSPAISAPS